MDSAVRLPGTRFRFGLDPILGLLPGAGDAVSAAISVYLIYEARKLGASRTLLGRMVGNILIDFLVGSIPIVGDLFDFGYKANRRNMKLLGIEIEPEQKTGRR